MLNGKNASIVFVFLVLSSLAIYAQTSDTREMTVEESYLEETPEIIVIREQSRVDSRDMKLVALEYIRDAVGGGRASEEILKSLEYLALEGSVNKTREGGVGPVVNNFPDVRAKAVSYLGEVGGLAARSVLIRVLKSEIEPTVITETIKALANINIKDDGEVVATIAWVLDYFHNLKPDNALAVSALYAMQKIAENSDGFRDAKAIQMIIAIAEGPYIRPVQAQAKKLLDRLRRLSASSSVKSSDKR